MGNLSASSMDSWTLSGCQPPTPTELQSHAQAPVLIWRQRVGGDTHRPNPPFTRQLETHNHHPRQSQAVAAQLHRLPAPCTAPQLPAIGIAAQAAKSLGMGQSNMPWQHPNTVRQAQQNAEHACHDRD